MQKSFLLLTLVMCCVYFGYAQSVQLNQQINQLKTSGSDARLRPSLLILEKEFLDAVKQGVSAGEFTSAQSIMMIEKGRIRIQATAQQDATTLIAGLEQLGATQIDQYERVVNAWLPIENISRLPHVSDLQFVKPVYYVPGDIGAATSEGDLALQAIAARQDYCVNGAGVRVGVLSDSYTTAFPGGAAAGVASGDLPGVGNPNGFTTAVTVVADGAANNIDEGRAMCEIVHDLAPGAQLFFNTANGGEAAFANAILNLDAISNCDVIVDDIRYFEEPFYMDGPVALACNTVFNNGVAYFASAGNYGTSSYESAYRNSGGTLNAHDFDPGPGVDTLQSITVNAGSNINLTLQWDDPWGSLTPNSAATNLDVFLINAGGVIVASSTDNNVGGDPTEFFSYVDPNGAGTATYRILITRPAGPATSVLKWVIRNSNGLVINEYPPTTVNALATGYGHSNATGANAVAAAFWGNTPAYGINPPQPEGFTSNGGVQIRYNTSGVPITPVTRNKPDFCAVDGTSNTFFGNNNNFFGTSAAAPHAAAVAALMLEANGSLTPTQVRDILVGSSIDMLTNGFDFTTGSGLIQADLAVAGAIESSCNISGITVLSGPSCVVNGTYSITLRVSYSSPPACNDQLWVNGQVFPATGASFQDVTLTGLNPNGNPVSVTAYFLSVPGCDLTVNNLYTAPTPLTVSVQDISDYNGFNISCFGGSDGWVTAAGSGGTPPYSYLWDDPAAQATATASGLSAGDYTVIVTDANGCQAQTDVTLTEPTPLTIDAGPNQTVYYGYPPAECATISASGEGGGVPPYNITWSDGGAQSHEVCPGLYTTTYTVTITDANGCTETDDVTICVIDVRCGKKLDKVELCHVPDGNPLNAHTICVSVNSVAIHLAHGDQLAACGTDHSCEDQKTAPVASSFDHSGESDLIAYPNPFSESATLEFTSGMEGRVTMQIFDYTGRMLKAIYDGDVDAGIQYTFQVNAEDLSPGLNICVLKHADGSVVIKKLILSK
jgi:hypothetical protein